MSRFHIALAVFVCVFAAAVLATGILFLDRTPTVTYDGETFNPPSLTVKLGQTVVFKNKSREAFWPAADLHPSHTLWSEFDPKEPIAENTAWSFTFTKPGTWTYHNHIRPTQTGTITVLGEGEDKITDDCIGDADMQKCWNAKIETALQEKSLSDVFAMVAELYEKEPLFRAMCHDAAHLIGTEMYDQFTNGQYPHLPETTSTCGYGFFHGFMETLFSISGDVEQARSFCTYINESLAQGNSVAFDACYHGIGHGTVDGSDPRAWGDPLAIIAPGLALCETVAQDANQRVQCGNGVFEGLVTLYQDRTFGLDIDRNEAYSLCLEVAENFKLSCYEQLNPFAAYIGKGDPYVTLNVVNSVQEERYKRNALRNAAGTLAHPDMSAAEYEEFIEACHTFSDELRPNCIFGFTAKLLEFGSLQSSQQIAIDFCRTPTLTENEKTVCFGRIVELSPASERESVCEVISPYITRESILFCGTDISSDAEQKNT